MLIGFLQTQKAISAWQACSAASFILGIVLLFLIKFVSAYQFSRDRKRFQETKTKFLAKECTARAFDGIRDRTFRILQVIYRCLQLSSGTAFLAGLVLLLIGIWP